MVEVSGKAWGLKFSGGESKKKNKVEIGEGKKNKKKRRLVVAVGGKEDLKEVSEDAWGIASTSFSSTRN